MMTLKLKLKLLFSSVGIKMIIIDPFNEKKNKPKL